MIEFGQDDFRRLNWFGLKPPLASLLASRAVNPLVQFAARNFLPAKIGRRLPLARRHVDYELVSGKNIRLLDPLHDIVARDIYWGASRSERRKLRVFERLCSRADILLDIGAYGALYALIAARSNPKLRAIAYEIVPQNYFHAVRNVLENDLTERIEVRLRGIGAAAGTVCLPISVGRTSFLSSVSLGSRFSKGVSIPVRTLDRETEGWSGSIVMKVDVEGYEDQVLAGGQAFMKRCLPDVICEILPDANAASERIEAMIRPLGYRTFTFEEAGVVERQKVEPQPVLRDWLFTTSKDVDALLASV